MDANMDQVTTGSDRAAVVEPIALKLSAKLLLIARSIPFLTIHEESGPSGSEKSPTKAVLAPLQR